jgi:hypothetical protein
MSNRTYYSGCRRLVAALLVNTLVCVGLTATSHTHEKQSTKEAGPGFDPFQYLPPGAKIKDRRKDVVFADLGGDGQKDVVIFYTVGTGPNDHKANILVLEAVRLYTLQKRYDDAIRLCGDVLRMMDDTSMTQPDSVYPGTKGQATIHKLLGDTYKVAGDLRNARREYQKAQSAIDGAK